MFCTLRRGHEFHTFRLRMILYCSAESKKLLKNSNIISYHTSLLCYILQNLVAVRQQDKNGDGSPCPKILGPLQVQNSSRLKTYGCVSDTVCTEYICVLLTNDASLESHHLYYAS